MKLLLALTLLLIGCRAAAWTVDFRSADGHERKLPATVGETMEGQRKLMFLAVPSPIAGPVKARLITEEGPLPILTVDVKGQILLLLTYSRGRIEVAGDNGQVGKYFYVVEPEASSVRLSATCAPLKLKQQKISQTLSPYPAALTCGGGTKKGERTEVVFSTMADAEWYGTGLFETGGKGERWKTFAAKDIIAVREWDLNWGAANQKNSATFATPAPVLPPVAVPKPRFHFWAGAEYLTGHVSRDETSSSVAGLRIPLRVIYQKERANWYLSTGYDFFAYAIAKANGSSNTVAGWQLEAGREFHPRTWTLRANVGYLSRAVDAPGVNVSSTFEAPRLGFSAQRPLKTGFFGVGLARAQTSNQGNYSEMEMGLFYERPVKKRTMRFELKSNQLKSSTSTLDFNASWLTLGALIKF